MSNITVMIRLIKIANILYMILLISWNTVSIWLIADLNDIYGFVVKYAKLECEKKLL